jgi:hypothetical protein
LQVKRQIDVWEWFLAALILLHPNPRRMIAMNAVQP